jgi:hypothetical protein
METKEKKMQELIENAVKKAITESIEEKIKEATKNTITDSNTKVIQQTNSLKKLLRGEKSLLSKVISWFNNYWIIVIIIALMCIDICCHISWNIIESDHIVLTFVGVLATFVVVSNYSQVKEVKDESNVRISDIKNELDHKYDKRMTELSDNVNSLSAMVGALKTTLDILAKSKRTSLEPSSYKILEIDRQQIVDNYYILIKDIPIEIEYLNVFIEQFKEQYCKKASNIYLLDDIIAYPSIKKYPLDGPEYLEVADHFVAWVIFDTDDVDMYPYQDIKYKELGGKNWKKEPIQ